LIGALRAFNNTANGGDHFAPASDALCGLPAPASDALCGLQLIINHLKTQFQNFDSQSRHSMEKAAKCSAVLN